MKKVIAALAAISVLLQNAAATVDASQAELTWEMILENPEIVSKYAYQYDEEILALDNEQINDIKFNESTNILDKYFNTYLANKNDYILSSRGAVMNTMFTNRLGALQDLAREYVDSLETDGSYDFNVNDGYFGMKDVWYCFYLLRYLALDSNNEQRYNDLKWLCIGGNEYEASNNMYEDGGNGSFVLYVQEKDPTLYSLLRSFVNSSANSTLNVYSSPTQKIDLGHFAACMTAYLWQSEGHLLSDILYNYDDIVHDNYACWGGDLGQLINNAYVTTAYDNMYDAVYNMMGESQYGFGLEDFYADVDAVNLKYILEAYRVNNGSGNADLESLFSSYYFNYETHVEDFTDTIWYSKIYYYTANAESLGNAGVIDYQLTAAERQSATLGFIDYCEDTFNVSIVMEGYTG